MQLILYFKEIPDDYLKKKGYELNRFNVFPRQNDEYIFVKTKDYDFFKQCIFEILFSLFKGFSLVMDVYCIDLKNRKKVLEKFFKHNLITKFKINSFVSFQIDDQNTLNNFVNSFCPLCDDLDIRVVNKNEGLGKCPGVKSNRAYFESVENVFCYVRLSVNPIFVEIFSNKLNFSGYENIVKEVAEKYNLEAKINKT